jgi:hypothetical protein
MAETTDVLDSIRAEIPPDVLTEANGYLFRAVALLRDRAAALQAAEAKLETAIKWCHESAILADESLGSGGAAYAYTMAARHLEGLRAPTPHIQTSPIPQVAQASAKAGDGGEARYPTCKSCGQVYVEDKGWRNCASCPTPCPKPESTKPVAEPSSPGHDELRRWREQGRAPAGSCPFCASRISVIERDGIFVARCSHRGCGARGPKHHDLTRACDLFCCPPQRTAGGMGGTDAMTDHPSKPIEYARGHFRGRLVFQPYAELAAATDADLTDIALALQSLDAEDRMRVLEQVPEWRELEDSAEYNGGVAADEHVKRGVAQAALTAAQSDAEKARDAKLTAEESCRQVLKTIADACDQESLAARRARSRA